MPVAKCYNGGEAKRGQKECVREEVLEGSKRERIFGVLKGLLFPDSSFKIGFIIGFGALGPSKMLGTLTSIPKQGMGRSRTLRGTRGVVNPQKSSRRHPEYLVTSFVSLDCKELNKMV